MLQPNAIPAALVPHLPARWQSATYAEVHAWASAHPADFWSAVWEATQPHHARTYALARLGKSWFIGSKVNLTAQVLEGHDPAATALYFRNELIEEPLPFERAEQYGQVASMAAYLRDQGIGKGDTVGVYMPVVPEALFAFYAAWAVGARVCYCGITLPPTQAAERLAAAEVKLLFAADGYRYGGQSVDRMPELESLQQVLPRLRRTVLSTYLDPDARWDRLCDTVTWLHTFNAEAATLDYRYVGFNHDAWVAGTQTLEQGALLLTALKYGLDGGIQPQQRCFAAADAETERLLWAVRMQLCGGVPVLFDGQLDYPNPYNVWKTAKEAAVTLLQLPAAGWSAEVDLTAYEQLPHLEQLLITGQLPLAFSAWRAAQLPMTTAHVVEWDTARQQWRNWQVLPDILILEHHEADSPAE